MTGVEAWLHKDPALAGQTNLNGAALRCCRLRWCPHDLHFDERFGRRLAQPLLPGEELRYGKTAIPAECRYGPAARALLRYQTSPLRPRLLFALSHTPTVNHCAGGLKMGFTQRSLMEYLRCMYVEQPQCGAILRAAFRFCYSILRADEEGALAEIDKAEREKGQSIRGDRPRKRSGVHVLRFDFDVSGLLERLRRGMGPDVKWGGTSLIATRTQTDGSLTIYRLSAMAFNVLILADGTMDTEEIAQMIASRCTRGGDRICWLPSGQLWNGRRRTGSSKVWLDGNASKGVDWKRVELDFCSGDAEASTSSAVRPAAWGENLHRRLRIGSLLGAPHDLLSSRHWRPLRPENVRGGLREGKFALQYIAMSIKIIMIHCKLLQKLEMKDLREGDSPVRKFCQSEQKPPFSTAFPPAGSIRLIFA